MSVEGAAAVVAPRVADKARVAAWGAPCRQTTTSRPGTRRAPPVFQGSLAAWVSIAACAPVGKVAGEGAPTAGSDEATSGTARTVVRARQAAMRARNEVSFSRRRAERAPLG